MKKFELQVLYLAISILAMTACSYEKTDLDLGSVYGSTWSFSKSSNYDFDNSLVEIVNGKAQLKAIDLEQAENDFSRGTHLGSTYSNSNIRLSTYTDMSLTHVNTIVPSQSSNLVGYWRFDNNLDDISTLNHSAVATGAAFTATSRVGTGALYLDGVDDFVEIPNTVDLNMTKNLTLSFWVRPENLGITSGLISKLTGSAEKQFSLAALSSNFFRVDYETAANNYGRNTSGAIEPLRWQHIVMTISDSLEIKVYKDGLMVLQDVAPQEVLQSGESIFIGKWGGSYNDRFFRGSIDEFAIWSDELSSAEVLQVYEAQKVHFAEQTELNESWTPKWSNIVGYWKMDGNWDDSSGNGHHGTNNDDSTFSDGSIVGSFAGSLDGADDMVNVAHDTSYELENVDYTIVLWTKINSFVAGNIGLVTKGAGSSSSSGFAFIYQSAGDYLQLLISDGTVRYAVTSHLIPEIENGGWHHLGVTIDRDDKTTFFLNGINVGSSTSVHSGANISNVTQQLRLGGWIGAWELDGLIDDVSIWKNEVLSPEEMSTIYNRQKQKYSGYYDSEIIDLGSSNATWPDLSWSTSLPFGKELVGDYNNDGSPDSDSSSSYPALTGGLSSGLVGYWTFNNQTNDYSGLNYPGTLNGDATYSEKSVLGNGSVFYDGSGDYIQLDSFFSSLQTFTYSFWVFPNNSSSGQRIFNNYRSTTTSSKSGISIRSDGRWGFVYSDLANAFTSIDVGADVAIGEWSHVTLTYDGNRYTFYVNGVNVKEVVDTISTQVGTSAEMGAFNNGTDHEFYGYIDEGAIWNRPLAEAEVSELYRRGANRIKLQVKSCADPSCSCESFNTSPQGDASDCDGDGVLNEVDTVDSFKSKFIGPGGDGTTYYSELYNRSTTDVTFNCALNTTDDDAGVCVKDEITLAGSSKPTGPEFLNIDYTQFVKPPANRYAQVRVYLEADDNTACGGGPCLPELKSISLNPSNTVKFASVYSEVKPKGPITFNKLIAINITAEPCASFRAARSGTSYYHDGSVWQPATDDIHRNTQDEFSDNIKQFSTQFGAGEFEVLGYLKSDVTQSQNCSIDEVDVIYE